MSRPVPDITRPTTRALAPFPGKFPTRFFLKSWEAAHTGLLWKLLYNGKPPFPGLLAEFARKHHGKGGLELFEYDALGTIAKWQLHWNPSLRSFYVASVWASDPWWGYHSPSCAGSTRLCLGLNRDKRHKPIANSGASSNTIPVAAGSMYEFGYRV